MRRGEVDARTLRRGCDADPDGRSVVYVLEMEPEGFDRDVTYLRDVQYRDSSQLAKRANLHVRYRTASRSVFEFFVALIDWSSAERVLDVGCGGGSLWVEQAGGLPAGITLSLADISPGMVEEAVRRATDTGQFSDVAGHQCDARHLPFPDGSFDVVVSTYALYHVPEPDTAVAELARVVASDGWVGIATNGPRHLAQLERVREAVFGASARSDVNEAFAPAIAAPMLLEHFDEVAWHRYDDTLLVTDVDDLMAFATSLPPAHRARPDQLEMMRSMFLESMVDGVVEVTKDTGVFVCRRPRRRVEG